MVETTEKTGEKKLSVAPSKTLSIKGHGAEQGVVRQSFSHGRTKADVVDKVNSRAPTRVSAESRERRRRDARTAEQERIELEDARHRALREENVRRKDIDGDFTKAIARVDGARDDAMTGLYLAELGGLSKIPSLERLTELTGL